VTESPVARAATFITFCDGADDMGHPEYARRGRVVARDLLRALDELAAERSARVAIQAARDEAIAILANHAHQALVDEQAIRERGRA
jgi:hypothetical protein